jgi:hypothetical protein
MPWQFSDMVIPPNQFHRHKQIGLQDILCINRRTVQAFGALAGKALDFPVLQKYNQENPGNT